MTKVHYISNKYKINDWPNELESTPTKGNGRILAVLLGFVTAGVLFYVASHDQQPKPISQTERTAIALEYLMNGLEGSDLRKPVIKPLTKPMKGE